MAIDVKTYAQLAARVYDKKPLNKPAPICPPPLNSPPHFQAALHFARQPENIMSA